MSNEQPNGIVTEFEIVPTVQIESAVVPINTAVPMLTLLDDQEPDEIIRRGHKAARVLMDVVSRKTNPVLINGETYLEYEDWLMVGRFFGVEPRITAYEYMLATYSEIGFVAEADAVHMSTGKIIGHAVAICSKNEKKSSDLNTSQLLSKAQTRACAKVLRLVFAWVVVLAGYKPTPYEEMADLATVQAQPKTLKGLVVT